MEQYQLGEMEERLADLIWEKEPLTSAELVKACGEAFDWKRTTTYTMLKRLIVRPFPSERNSATRMWRSFGSSLTNTRRSSGWSDGRVL